ncbi:hypothetical protein HK100_011168 [Physocladia obscura]|uniref:Uncharacterized protein n=1 Tax=Physocladia obscura TaxID=109957 RepID=A0AAD5T8V0_9FUNG|nr:hypothetical protein HK100_011168 [Physocladia obscura]
MGKSNKKNNTSSTASASPAPLNKRIEQVKLAQRRYRERKKTRIADLEARLAELQHRRGITLLSTATREEADCSSSSSSSIVNSSKTQYTNDDEENPSNDSDSPKPQKSNKKRAIELPPPQRRRGKKYSNKSNDNNDKLAEYEAIAQEIGNLAGLRIPDDEETKRMMKRLPIEDRRRLQIRFAQRRFALKHDQKIKELEDLVRALEVDGPDADAVVVTESAVSAPSDDLEKSSKIFP